MPINTKDLDVKLEETLKKVFKIEKINLESSIEDISEWDSFTHIQLIISLQEDFKCHLQNINKFLKISKLIIIISENCSMRK